MPRVDISLRDLESSVIRPVAFSVIRDVLEATQLEANTGILFPGNSEVGYQPSTTVSAQNENRERKLLAHGKRVFIEHDEDYDEEGAITSAVMKPENRFIFVDDLLDFYIKPVYSTINATLTIRYRAKDRVEALRWRDSVRSRIQLGRRQLLHQVDYHYLIPESVDKLLTEIHRLRENVMGYDETLEEYKNNFFTKRKTVVSTLNGTELRDAITERQRRIIGQFEFGNKPERMEKDSNGDAWTIAFTYRYTYERPINLVLHYPIVVHNQLLSSQYRVDKPTDRDDYHILDHTMTTSALKYFEPDRLIDLWKNTRGIYLPNFDDFIPKSVLPNSLRLFTGLVLIDLDNPEILMNFGDLGEWSIEEDIKEFLKTEAPFMKYQYKSVFDLSFYRNRDLFDQSLEMIELDSDLNVNLLKSISPRNYFHVRLGLCSDLTLLDKDAQNRLRQNSCVLKKILSAIAPFVDISSIMDDIENCGPVDDDHWNKIIDTINKTDPLKPNPIYPYSNNSSFRIGYNTVQNFFIRTEKAVQ